MGAPRIRPKVLLVDDRSDNLVAMQAVLSPLPCDIATATSGEAALKALLQDDYAVILLDVQMPGLDGFETARLIKARKRTRSVPIIFVTAISTEPPNIHAGYAVGAVDYLFKPYDPDVLRAKVGVFLELHVATRALAESEGLWRSIFENAPIGMARLDARGRIEHANRALGTLLGRTAVDLRRRMLDALVAEDTRGSGLERREALLAGSLGGYASELVLLGPREERIPCACSFSAVHGDGSEPIPHRAGPRPARPLPGRRPSARRSPRRVPSGRRPSSSASDWPPCNASRTPRWARSPSTSSSASCWPGSRMCWASIARRSCSTPTTRRRPATTIRRGRAGRAAAAGVAGSRTAVSRRTSSTSRPRDDRRPVV